VRMPRAGAKKTGLQLSDGWSVIRRYLALHVWVYEDHSLA